MKVPERFNFARDVVERHARDEFALTFVDAAGAVAVHRQDWRNRLAVIAKRLIGGVCDERDFEVAAQIEQPLARRAVYGLPSGVREFRGEIGEGTRPPAPAAASR